MAVCRPYAASNTSAVKKQARLHVGVVATFSVLFNVTRFFEYEIGPPSSPPPDPLYEYDDELYEVDDSLRANPTWLTNNFWYKVRASAKQAVMPS